MQEAGRIAGILSVALLGVNLAPMSGCDSTGFGRTAREGAIAGAARPILSLDPDAVWTDRFNELAEFGSAAIDYLMEQPAMTRRAPPDDLEVLVHTSLVRLLAEPGSVPKLSASCLETTLDLLHFDVKVGGRSLGTVAQADRAAPRAWHDLYPADFDQGLAAEIDLEGDRQALCAWWRRHRDDPSPLVAARRLRPRARHLWPVLARRPADRWQYQPEARAVRCAVQSGPALLQTGTYDYNLVRAACVWLGASAEAEVQERLIELVASPLPVVAHNARFALGYAREERVRETIRRYDVQPPER